MSVSEGERQEAPKVEVRDNEGTVIHPGDEREALPEQIDT